MASVRARSRSDSEWAAATRESRAEIARLAGEDGKTLYDAAQIVRGRADAGGHAAHSAEHLAFTLITAAHEQLRQRAAGSRPESGS